MRIIAAGLSYKTAPVEVREKLAVALPRLRCHGCRLKLRGGFSELLLVSTCNRVELYGVTSLPVRAIPALFQWLSNTDFDFSPYVYVREGAEAVKHLFSVTSGLDSMVMGETEITGQVKQAYQACQDAKLTGRITNRLFQTALQTAKEVRTQTGIGRGSISVGSVAVDLAERIFDRDLSQRAVMIIGAGKMGEACVRHLAKKGASAVLVANRSYDRAASLAAEIQGQAVRFEGLLAAMADVDIVVSSTGCPQAILNRANLAPVMAARRNRPLFLVDIAVPRDVDADVEQLENVYLYNIDHIESIVRENLRQRELELSRCQAIIAGHVQEFLERVAARPAGRPTQPAASPQPAFHLFQPAPYAS